MLRYGVFKLIAIGNEVEMKLEMKIIIATAA